MKIELRRFTDHEKGGEKYFHPDVININFDEELKAIEEILVRLIKELEEWRKVR